MSAKALELFVYRELLRMARLVLIRERATCARVVH